jgi:hypothetical protein
MDSHPSTALASVATAATPMIAAILICLGRARTPEAATRETDGH